MIERKLILCSAIAIVIGIAAIIPMEYVMVSGARANAEAQANAMAQATAALTNVEPWFNVSVQYAYCNPYKNGGNSTMSFNGAMIQAVANFSLTPEALENADAQIEYYKFAVSSDRGPIVEEGYYVSLEREGITTGASGNGTIWFANGLVFNGPISNGGQGINWDVWKPSSTLGFVSDYIFGTDASDIPKAVTELRNAQTLYIDVSKVCTVTVKGNVTVTTPSSSQVLQHIELTEIGSGFVYGTYADGTLPFPVEVP
jgi:hypothetical protein